MKILNKQTIMIGGAAAFLALALIFWYIAAVPRTDDTVKLPVYFYNPTLSQLEAEERTLPAGENDKVLYSAIETMWQPPKNTAVLTATLPEASEGLLIGYALNGSTLEAVFSSSYYDIPPIEEALFRSAFTLTMLELPFIEQVHFTVEGNELVNSRGNAFGLMDNRIIQTAPRISPERIATRSFTLYFVSGGAEGLVKESHTTATVNMDQPERYIVQQLISAPTEEGVRHNAIPIDTQIRDIKTEDSICYVNLSAEFRDKFSGNATLARLTLYSIVNSLVENVSNVRRVQFLIETEKQEEFHGVADFSRPFEKDDNLVLQ